MSSKTRPVKIGNDHVSGLRRDHDLRRRHVVGALELANVVEDVVGGVHHEVMAKCLDNFKGLFCLWHCSRHTKLFKTCSDFILVLQVTPLLNCNDVISDSQIRHKLLH